MEQLTPKHKNSSPFPKILLIAVDGLSFQLLKRWSTIDSLPCFKRIIDYEGSYGVLQPFSPSNSAVIWTTIMTGMNPKKHGIDSFVFYRAGGRVLKKTIVKRFFKLGVRPLFKFLKKRGKITEIPFSLNMVQEKMLWEIFAQAGFNIGVVNWWYSWPAQKVPGFIVSDRIFYHRLQERGKCTYQPDTHLVYPEGLFNAFMENKVNPFTLSVEIYKQFMAIEKKEIEALKNCHYKRHQLMSEFKYLFAMDESVRKITLWCLHNLKQPDFLALYFRGIDIISHCALQYDTCYRTDQITTQEAIKFGETVHYYYQYIDNVIKELTENIEKNTVVMIVSDHGFDREPDGRIGHRKTKPPGLFMLCGPNIKKGLKIEGASLYDIAPTLLYLGGLPVSKQMEGSVLLSCIKKDFFQIHPVQFLESYGSPIRHNIVDDDIEAQRQIQKRLRALGYIE